MLDTPNYTETEKAFGIAARSLRSAGYSSLPLVPFEKRPTLKAWSQFCDQMLSERELARYADGEYGLGVACGFNGLVSLDFDTEDQDITAAVEAILPQATVAKRGARGKTSFYRFTHGKVPSRKWSGRDDKIILELLGHGRQCVLPPTTHPSTRQPYIWLTERALWDIHADDLPELPSDVAEQIERVLAPWLPERPSWSAEELKASPLIGEATIGGNDRRYTAYAESALSGRCQTLATMFKNSGRNNALFVAACYLGKWVHHGSIGEQSVVRALLDACDSNGLRKEDGTASCLATIQSGLARAAHDPLPKLEDRPRLNEATTPSESPTNDDGPPAENSDPRPPEYSDEALALRYAERHVGDLRYVAVWSKWLVWDGRRWARDDTMLACDFSRRMCRELASRCSNARLAMVLASARTVSSVERLAKADRALAAIVDQWDSDPWLLNTPDGVINLRSSEMLPHDPEHYLTKMTAVAPGGRCPRWLEFLDEITDKDKELQGFLQRQAGYSLTGLTQEHALFFGYGTGANGKSVYINTISGVLGDYHRTAPIETFTASSGDRHPTELAMLRGARLVTAVETEEGRRWAESRIKALTGGDRIAARFMKQDFFEFAPAFKLFIVGNHKPSLRTVDEAIRRRLHMIPFTVTIPPERRDGTLTDKLRDEWPAILGWMIDGLHDWMERGLSPPEAVTEATKAYLDAEDATGAWLEECCEKSPDAWDATKRLFSSWKDWSERAGEFTGSARQMGDRLEARGYIRHRRNRARGHSGLQRIPDSVPDHPHWNPG